MRTLTAARKLDTPQGQAALVLARRLDLNGEAVQSLAQAAKQLDSLLERLTRGVTETADPVDELAERRRRRLGGA